VTNRIRQLRSVFARDHIDCLLVQNDINITYLTGFPSSESWLLVSPRRTFYITDFRYVLEAQKGLKGIAVKQYTRSIFELFYQIIKEQKCKRIGIDECHITHAQYQLLSKNCPKGVKLIKANGLVEQFREVKDVDEIKKIKKALQIHKQALQYLKKVIKPKISERDIFLKLERFVKVRGAGFSFDPIVASGTNSCYPHAKISNRKVRNNEPVLIDIGIDVEGYKSDLTRMFFLGKISELVKRVNEHVSCAQRIAIDHIQPGVLVSEVDLAARNYLTKNGLGKYFGHALGHGVGLEIHEDPRLAQNNSTILKPGMIITVEPAVYIPEKFGIRIEDMVLVTKKGCIILSDNID
jgi:Xaa-Pro aminopeptidase